MSVLTMVFLGIGLVLCVVATLVFLNIIFKIFSRTLAGTAATVLIVVLKEAGFLEGIPKTMFETTAAVVIILGMFLGAILDLSSAKESWESFRKTFFI